MLELLMQLNKETLAALCYALLKVHQSWNAKKIIKQLIVEQNEKHIAGN